MAQHKKKSKKIQSPRPSGPVPLPEAFLASVSQIDGLAAALDTSAPVSVRLNPYKKYFPDFVGQAIPWCSEASREGEAYYLSDRPVFTADPAFHGGAYYVQEASSMFAGWLLSRLPEIQEEPLRILDLCAAPGGKTTHLAAVAGPRAVVVANEVIRTRSRILAENVQKWGTGNVVVTSNDPADFGKALPGFFDVVAVDAPCSGEGMFRKDPVARAEWSPEHVQLCAARQRRILSDVWNALRPGGVLIYSTCTFNRTENEENAAWIAGELGGEFIDFAAQLPPGAGIVESRPGCYRFYPHRVEGEGFFAAVLRKPDTGDRSLLRSRGRNLLAPLSKAESDEAAAWLDSNSPVRYFATGGGTVYGYTEEMYGVMPLLLERLNVLYSGVQMGEMVRGALQKPAHALALYRGVSRKRTPVARLEYEQAMEYLRKAAFTAAGGDSDPLAPFTEGWNLVTYRDIALGWIKRIGNRCNNLYPQNWRVLNY